MKKSLTLAIITLLALSYYWIATEWNLFEFIRFCGGIIVLWMPFGAVFYILLGQQAPDPIIRFTFSTIASYTLTTLIYFGLAVLKIEPLFYIGQISILIGLIIYLIKAKFRLNFRIKSLNWRHVNWVLASLIAVSLVVNIPYQIAWDASPKADTYTFTLFPDHLLHIGQAYELARHVPPQQQAYRANTPERAYHMFPHLTTMLLSRFTRQADMLRVHIIYHYTIIEIGMCLALYSIVKTLTKSRIAGYIATATMYITAISYPPLVKNSIGYFYFTLFPHVSSGIEPAILTSPQMYSGMLVAYGILLGVALISIRVYRKKSVNVILIITAIMVAATSRFRIHVFLPMLPGFLLLTVYGWKRTRQKAYFVAAGLVVVLSLLIYLEMQSPVYLKGTTNLKLGFNGLTDWMNSWPLSDQIYVLLSHEISNKQLLSGIWTIISMSAFVALNMIGIPSLIITSIYLFSESARHEFRLFTSLIVWMTVMSTLGAIFLTTDYDHYSVGGQLLLTTHWYPFLLIIPGLCQIHQFLLPNLSIAKPIQINVIVALIILSLIAQQLTRPSLIMTKLQDLRMSINADERMALAYIHDQTSQNSVILAEKYVDKYTFILSGLSGRSAYLEAANNVLDQQAMKLNPLDNRRKIIRDLWKTTEPEKFCQILIATPTTHLIEYSNHPLFVHNLDCMHPIWESPNQNQNAPSSSKKITIWKVKR